MNKIFKIVALTLVISIASVFSASAVSDAIRVAVKSRYLYLVVGLDDAAENTDAILIVSYDSEKNNAAVLMLPRDTYCSFGDRLNKINHMYSSFKLSGLNADSAMKSTTEFLGRRLGVKFDGYFAITTELFRSAIDSIGGVEITLSEDFTYTAGEESFHLTKVLWVLV